MDGRSPRIRLPPCCLPPDGITLVWYFKPQGRSTNVKICERSAIHKNICRIKQSMLGVPKVCFDGQLTPYVLLIKRQVLSSRVAHHVFHIDWAVLPSYTWCQSPLIHRLYLPPCLLRILFVDRHLGILKMSFTSSRAIHSIHSIHSMSQDPTSWPRMAPLG